MWEQLESYRNHFIQKDFKTLIKPSTINQQQQQEWKTFYEKRDYCKPCNQRCPGSSTYFDDRAQLAYGWFALPKLMKEMNSDVSLTHWRAIVSLSEFLLNPLNVQRAILEMDIVRKVKNAFMRMRLKHRKEQYNEVETYLRIFNIISRNLDGAEHIANRKCLMVEFYKILQKQEPLKEHMAAEILRNLTGKPKVLGIILADDENFASVAKIFKQDPCQRLYSTHLWHHLCDILEVAPEQGIELGLFELLHSRIFNRLPKFWDMTAKAFALLLRCEEGQRRFDEVDAIKMIYDIFEESYIKPTRKLPLQQVENYEYVLLMLLNGLHSKKALWRSREFTMLTCHVARLCVGRMKTPLNPRLQLYCLKALRELAVMPCTKRYMIDNWLTEIQEQETLDADTECARDGLVDWLRRDIADSS
ncbi:CG13501 [Drosophila busckii]|uniref:CG13501 n=1 Tax=Drosophila busckii TaxID=30019 RepID=A0A0M4EJ19_DROBS|nr:uncharacterized protein LOC108595500 [Drosophila busckii]ALC41192.1 CG13501 [Drosophila busckii]